jgi:hypothetical protein
MSTHSDAKLVDVAGIVLGFLDVRGGRVRHELSDADFAQAILAVEEARHAWRAERVRVREARGSRADRPTRAH